MELKVFVVRTYGTDADGDSYDDPVDRVFAKQDVACEYLMKLKRDWMEENKCPDPTFLTDKFDEFSLYKHVDNPLEYAGKVHEVPFISLDVLDDKQMFAVADELFHAPYDGARYAIFKELQLLDTDEIAITDEQMKKLISQCIEVYDDYDYATPTGVGVAILNHILNTYDQEDSFDLDDFINDLDKVKKAYESSDWR